MKDEDLKSVYAHALATLCEEGEQLIKLSDTASITRLMYKIEELEDGLYLRIKLADNSTVQ